MVAGHNGRLSSAARILVLLVVPLLLVGPSLLGGRRFLPQAPVMYEPLRSEYPELAARAEVGSNRFTGDRIYPVLSDQIELRRRLFAGESWVWEEKQGLGTPLLGNVIHGPFYPPNVLALAAPPDLAAGWLGIVTLFLAGAGAWVFLARRGLHESACLFAALVYQGTGWGVVNLHYPMKVDAALWLPWCLWALDGLRRGDPRGGPLLALGAAATAVAGFPPIAGFVLSAVAVTAVVWSIGDVWLGASATRAVRGIAAVALALMLGGAIAAVQLVPTAAAALTSPRGAPTAHGVAANTLALAMLPLAAVPDAFTRPTEDPSERNAIAAWLAPREHVDSALKANSLEWNTHAGCAVFLLALIGCASGRRAIAPALLLALAFGWAQDWPGFRVLYLLPGLNGGLATRALAVAWFAWVWLAALAVDDNVRGSTRRRAMSAAVAIALALIALAAAHLALPSAMAIESDLAARYGLAIDAVRALLPLASTDAILERLGAGLDFFAVVGILVAAALALLAWRPRQSALAAVPLVLAIATEVLVVSRAHLLPRDVGPGPLFPHSNAVEAIARAADGGRVVRLVTGGIQEVTGLARPNLLQVEGVADLTAYIAFQPELTARWFAAIDPRMVERGGILGLPDVNLIDDPRLDLAGVTCVLASELIVHPRLSIEFDSPGLFVYRRRNDLTRDEWLTEAPHGADEMGARDLAERAFKGGAITTFCACLAWALWVTLLARRRTKESV